MVTRDANGTGAATPTGDQPQPIPGRIQLAEKIKGTPAYPVFRFVVEVENVSLAVFTECALPDLEIEIEEVREGGLNTYSHQLPGRRRQTRISLKNGVGKCGLLDWYFQILSGCISRRSVTITLKDSNLSPVMVWYIKDAFPYKWTGPQLRAEDSTIAIETLELACGEITMGYGEQQ